MRRHPPTTAVEDLPLEVLMSEASLFPLQPTFDGPDLKTADHERLAKQHERVLAVMSDHQWRTLDAIATLSKSPAASASAQLRHLRKPRFGSHVIDRRHVGGGLYQYRLVR